MTTVVLAATLALGAAVACETPRAGNGTGAGGAGPDAAGAGPEVGTDTSAGQPPAPDAAAGTETGLPVDPDASAPVPDASGGVDVAPSPEVAAFLGTWQYVSGSSSLVCGNNPRNEDNAGTQFRLEQAADAPLVMRADTCLLKLDVAGTRASVRPGQSCPRQSSAGVTATLTFSSGTLALGSSSLQVDLVASGGFPLVPTACQLIVTGEARRAAASAQ